MLPRGSNAIIPVACARNTWPKAPDPKGFTEKENANAENQPFLLRIPAVHKSNRILSKDFLVVFLFMVLKACQNSSLLKQAGMFFRSRKVLGTFQKGDNDCPFLDLLIQSISH